MNSDFIQAVRRIVEQGHPPQVRSTNPAAFPSPLGLAPRPPAVRGVIVQQQLSDSAWSLAWDPVPTAAGYEVRTNPDPSRLMRWVVRGRVPEPAAQIKLSTVSDRLWVRVRAYGQAGFGAWSDPILLRRNQATAQKAA